MNHEVFIISFDRHSVMKQRSVNKNII